VDDQLGVPHLLYLQRYLGMGEFLERRREGRGAVGSGRVGVGGLVGSGNQESSDAAFERLEIINPLYLFKDGDFVFLPFFRGLFSPLRPSAKPPSTLSLLSLLFLLLLLPLLVPSLSLTNTQPSPSPPPAPFLRFFLS